MKSYLQARILQSLPLIIFLLSFGQLRAAEIDVKQTSLKLIPADASMYSANFQLREQVGRIVNSKAFEKVKSHPLVQMGVFQAKMMWDSKDINSQAMDYTDVIQYIKINQIT